VSVHYDPMLAKVIAHGATRAEAVRALAGALRRARIHGVTTNRDLLVGVLEHPEFAAGRTDTHFLERHPPATLAGGPDPAEVTRSAVAAALSQQHQERRQARVWAQAPSGWRNNPAGPATRRYRCGDDHLEVGYRIGAPGGTIVEIDGARLDVTVGEVTAGTVELTAGGVRRRYHVDIDATSAWVDTTRGGVRLTPVPRFPPPEASRAAGSLVAPMPGVVVRVDVAEGDTVTKGQRLLVLEAMKMEHQVTAPAAGIVSALNVKTGLSVDAGAVLVVVDEWTEQEGKG
jgi:propionyl-CoA carboxylase alpha chain